MYLQTRRVAIVTNLMYGCHAYRRLFTTVGLAAGVSAGFDAPIGSLMLAMEDMSSFWSRRLACQTFFGAIISILTTKLINTAYTGFQATMTFGKLNAEVEYNCSHM